MTELTIASSLGFLVAAALAWVSDRGSYPYMEDLDD